MYPEDEYSYIRQLIADRAQGEKDRKIYPLYDRMYELLRKSNYVAVFAMEEEIRNLYQQLVDERTASENRLRWLEIDSELRLKGKTYPDVYESPSRPRVNSSF